MVVVNITFFHKVIRLAQASYFRIPQTIKTYN